MQRRFLMTTGMVFIMGALASGCAPKGPPHTGFLSDYSKLQQDGNDLRFIDDKELPKYRKFIVVPVAVHFHEEAKGVHIDKATQSKLAKFMHKSIIDALKGRYEVVSKPGPGVARIFVAITDVKNDTAALNVIPTTRVTGLGLGGASMEAEVLDSRTNQQIGAAILTGTGKSLSLDGFKNWSSAEAVMKGWAKNFRVRLDSVYNN